MSFNGKIRIRSGLKGKSKSFMVVENYRRKDNGRPANRIVLYLGTLGSSEWFNTLTCQKFWDNAEREIDAAILKKQIPIGDSQKIKGKLKSGLGLPMQHKVSDQTRQRIIEKYAILR